MGGASIGEGESSASGELQCLNNYEQYVKFNKGTCIFTLSSFHCELIQSCLLIVYFRYIVSSELCNFIICILIYDKINLYNINHCSMNCLGHIGALCINDVK